MKLLKEFHNQVSNFENLKRVWLTSFKINIEKYILPAVLRMEIPRTRMDYEALQVELINSGIDFRVFCDKRFMGLEGNKRTAIPIYGLSPKALGFSKENIFHAKVIYLEGSRSETSIVGSGSANLTFGGWARNQEVFHFQEIESSNIQNSVIQFFSRVFQDVDPDEKIVKRQGLADSSKIQFCHSFQETSFIDQLKSDSGVTVLSVWSPYFPSDLAAFSDKFKKHFDEPDFKLNIVPDRVEGQYLRTEWTDAIEQKIKNQEICFFSNPVPVNDRTSLCHAKVWKTDKHLAIGSWNFTNAGSNIPQNGEPDFKATSNIEAGFIIENTASVESILGSPFSAGESAFATPEQMGEEALDVPEMLPFDLFIAFHWSDLTYRFYGTWNEGAVEDKTYRLKLPGVEKPVELMWKPRAKTLDVNSVIVRRPDKLLVDRKYEVLKYEKNAGFGLIIEEDVKCRRPQQYEDLRSLFDAMILGADDDSGAPISVDEDDSGQVWVNGRPLHGDDPAHIVAVHDEDISFFRLFSASYQYAMKLEQVEDMKTLEHWVFMRPGCLEELVNKTTDKIGNVREATVFNWFLAKEVNELIVLARKCRNCFYKSDDDIPLERWNSLEVSIPKMSIEANAEYQNIISKEYERMHKTWGKHE